MTSTWQAPSVPWEFGSNLCLTTPDEARAAFREQITALIEGGVDLIIIETMMDLNEAHQALLAAREVGKFPVVVQITVQADGSTRTGTKAEDFAGRSMSGART